jgi:hypothetical protein
VIHWDGQKETKISEVTLNLSSYIGRGLVKDNIAMTGNVYFVDFEIAVGKTSEVKKLDLLKNGMDNRLTAPMMS